MEPLKGSRPGKVTYKLCFGRSGTLGGKETRNADDSINLLSGFELHSWIKNKAGLEGFHDKLNVVGEEVENVQEDSSLCWGDYIVKSAMHQEN